MQVTELRWKDSTESFGSRLAIVDCEGRSCSYTELSKKIEIISGKLKSSGIRSGSRAILLQNKSVNNVATILSVLDCDAAYVPVDCNAPLSRIGKIISDAEAEIVIADEDFISCIDDSYKIVSSEDGLVIAVSYRKYREVPELAYILYTSGSTGHPKGVAVSSHAAIAFIQWCKTAFSARENDRVASIAPFHFDLSIHDLFVTLSVGASLHLFNANDVRNLRLMAEKLAKAEISIVYATPTFLSSLIQFGKPEKFVWKTVRIVLFAGEIFPTNTLHALMKLWSGAEFYNLYGPTETNVVTYYKIPEGVTRSEPYPIGKACNGHLIEVSADGILRVSGPHLAEGYWNDIGKTTDSFSFKDGVKWFATGDIVTIDEKGDYVYRGRADRMIKRYGFRIEPGEIEHAAIEVEGIVQSVCFSRSDREGNAKIILIVVTARGFTQDEITFRNSLLDIIPSYMMPDRIIFNVPIPVTSSGKTDYVKLGRQIPI